MNGRSGTAPPVEGPLRCTGPGHGNRVPLRLLILEDDANDAALAQRSLTRAGYQLDALVVSDRDGFLDAIRSSPPDIVLTDYHLPYFSGADAIRICAEEAPGVPVIVFSGVLGDEEAVDLLQLGAADYVLKDRPARLVSAVERALAFAAEQAKLRRAEDERRQAEDAVRESERRSRSLVQHSSDLIVLVDADGCVSYSNPAAHRSLRLDDGAPLVDHLHPADRDRVAAALAASDATPGRELSAEFRGDGRGEWRTYEAVVVSHRDDPALGGRILNARDVTSRVRAEAALEESRARLADLIDIAPDAIVGIDRDRNIILFNQGAETTFGYSTADVLGRPLDVLLPADIAAQHSDAIERFALEGPRSRRMGERQQVSGRRKDGSTFPAEASISKLQRDDELIFTAIVRDVSARDAAERLLAAQADQLARSNAELQEFAYVASHDLSEPLRTVAGFVQLLAQRYQGKLDDDADEFIGFTLDGVKRMQTLIQDLLTYSRVSRLEYELEPVDCNRLVQDIIEELSVAGAVSHGPLPTVQADPGQLHRVFQNLISNAVKFASEDRQPHVAVSAVEEDGCWRFAIADNGIGIAEQYRERIFKMFQRLHSADQYPGTGIGLAVCQRVVERHGGRIWVDSIEGEGSTFYFTLPAVGATS